MADPPTSVAVPCLWAGITWTLVRCLYVLCVSCVLISSQGTCSLIKHWFYKPIFFIGPFVLLVAMAANISGRRIPPYHLPIYELQSRSTTNLWNFNIDFTTTYYTWTSSLMNCPSLFLETFPSKSQLPTTFFWRNSRTGEFINDISGDLLGNFEI